MCACDERDVDALADEILRYLHAHRHAGDTPEGIVHWWIKRQRLEDSIVRVQSALDLLVSRSQIIARQTPGGATFYSLLAGRLPEGDPEHMAGDGSNIDPQQGSGLSRADVVGEDD